MVPQTVIGWDLGKNSSYVTAVSQGTGELLKEGKLANEPEAMREWLEGLPRPIRVIFEATGNWQATYEVLEPQVEELQMAHPLETRAIAHARIKTDRIDAATLAHLGRADLVPQSWIPPREVRDLRELLRHRAFLVSLQSKVKNRIHTYLAKTGTPGPDVTQLFGKAGKAYLAAVPLRAPYRFLLDRDLAVLETLQGEIQEVAHAIEAAADLDPRAAWLLPIHGLGKFAVMLILAEVGTIERFSSPAQLVSYAGLCPSTYQSGQTIRHGSLTKRGSKWLRWILVEAAIHYGRAPGRLGEYYRRLSSRKGAKVARVAVARKLLESIFWCLKKGVVYEDVSQKAGDAPNGV